MSAITATITPAQVDAKSPIDERLMQAIREDLYALDNAISAAGAFDYQFKLNGRLAELRGTSFLPRRRIDGCMLSKSTTFSAARILLERPGSSGTFEVDIRRYLSPNVALTGLAYLYSDSISSIGRVGSALSTQSVARSTSQISTQSIARWKSQLTISSIALITANAPEFGDDFVNAHPHLVRVNLSTAPDADWIVGDTVTFAGATDAGNDGDFAILAVNVDGGNNLIISNASAVAQNTVVGTADLDAWKFVYTNPVSTEFAAGESVLLASHTNALNNGTFPIYAINQGGNNIIVKNATMVAQGGAVGNANVTRWKYALASAALTADYVVGEYAAMSGHTSGLNDGNLRITAVNLGSNNIVVSNAAGVSQGGAAGTINSNRWKYTLATDPSSDISVGHLVWTSDATSAANRGQFTVVNVNVSSGLNIVVYNASGATQASSGGNLQSSRVAVKFAASQASYVTTDSRITLFGLPVGADSSYLDGEYDVLVVNRGGGSNFNTVVNMYQAPAGYSGTAMGRLVLESKSLFDTRPSVAVSTLNGKWCDVSSNAVLNATQAIVPAGTLVMMDVLNIPQGDIRNATVQLF